MTSQLNQDRIRALDANEDYELPSPSSRYFLHSDGTLLHPGGERDGATWSLGDAIREFDFRTYPLVVQAGEYDLGKFRDPLPGGRIMAQARRGVIIKGFKPGDTMTLESEGIGELTFAGLYIQGSSRSAFITLDSKGPYLCNFEDCTFDGGYNHAENTGFDSKWLMMTHRWSGYLARCNFMNVKREHALYAHTLTGDTLVYDCHMKRTGRTNIQVVGREHESGYGDAEISIQDSRFEDSGLADGGSSLTLGGVRRAEVINVTSTLGANREFLGSYLSNHTSKKALGQGHLVNWSDGGRQKDVQDLLLRNVSLWSDPDGLSGTAACAQIKACQVATLDGLIHMQHGRSPKAIEFGGYPAIVFTPEVWDVDGQVTGEWSPAGIT